MLSNLIGGDNQLNKKIISILLSLSIVSYLTITTYAKEPTAEKKIDNLQSIINLRALSKSSLKLSEKNGQIFLSGNLSKKLVPGENAAIQFLEENKQLFGIENTKSELKPTEIKKDNLGGTFVRLAQIINGVKLEGNLVNVYFNKSGIITSVSGKLEKNKSITKLGSKSVSAEQAVETAKKQYTYKSLINTPKAEKLVLTKNNKNYEVYKVNIFYSDPSIGNWDVYVETSSGKVINTETNIRYDGPATGSGIDVQNNLRSLNLYLSGASFQMRDMSKTATGRIDTFDMRNGTSTGYLVNSTSNHFSSEHDKASVSAHYNAGRVIDFYKNVFNRNSLDNNNMIINSFTHYGTSYNNAFWDGREMVYGDGDGNKFTYLSGDLDVVGHEMTHGVVSYTANLTYHNQSGALNESFADVFGVLISTYDKYNVAGGGSWRFNEADWVIGDDIYTPNTLGDALRSLSNPNLYGQPDRMSDYVNYPDTEAGDWGGVHTNSGIPNKAAFLVAKNIGLEKTAKIYYRALSYYMTSNTNFVQAKNALEQSAADLYGFGSNEASAVSSAFAAVGIGQSAPNDTYEPNNNFSEAHSISIGNTYQSYITSSVDVDYYKLNITNAGRLTIKLTNLPNDNDLKLYDANGVQLKESIADFRNNEEIVYDAQPGHYYVCVYPYSGFSTTQMYSLSTALASNNTLTAIGELEFPAENTSVSGTVNVSGWYLDPVGVKEIMFFVDGQIYGDADYGDYRGDIGASYPEYNNYYSGFHYNLNTSNLTRGQHTMYVFVINNSETGVYLPTRTFYVNNDIAVTGVRLDKNTAALKVGESVKLTATVTPSDASNKNVTWSSSNTSVATVDSGGNVKAIGKGSAVITVKTADGGFIANCNITVIAGWVNENGKWYYYDARTGQKKVGWFAEGSTWYYFKADGSMATGWVLDGGTWYYMSSSGAMCKGWVLSGGKWYYMKSNGAMATGWVQSGGKWYYMRTSGVMATGWLQLGNKWYYLYSNGEMAVNTTINGYKIGPDGVWIH
jgi:Zn-dependent metalloprotease